MPRPALNARSSGNVLRVLAAAALLACAGGGSSEPRTLAMRVEGVRFDPQTESPVVLLEETAGAGRRLPIWIGPYEARSIAMEMGKVDPTRPNTHDLLVSVLGTMSGTLDRVVITELRGNTYYAVLEISRDGRILVVDSRPSDAIAIAIRTGSPVAVAAELLERISLEDSDAPPREIRWNSEEALRNLRPRAY